MNFFDMDIQAKKLELFDLILRTDKMPVLEKISNILKEEGNWRKDVPDEIVISVEKGLQQAKSGNTISNEEVMKKYSKWL